jgi:hypothetical protein
MATRKYLIQGSPELPATIEDWNSARKITHKMSTNDAIELCHLALVKEKNGAYLDTIKGRTNAETVNGLIVIDQTKAAEMIVEKAVEMELVTLENVQLAVVYKGLNSMLAHRYGKSRAMEAKRSRVLVEHAGGGNPGEHDAGPAASSEGSSGE